MNDKKIKYGDKKFDENIYIPCSCGSRLKIEFLEKELKNEKELFFMSYYHKNKIKIIKFIYFENEKFYYDLYDEIEIKNENIKVDTIKFSERKSYELLFCFKDDKITWINIYKFNKNNEKNKFNLIKSFIVDFEIKSLICFDKNDIIVLINDKEFGIIQTNENEEILKKGKFFKKSLNDYAVRFLKYMDKQNKAIMIIVLSKKIYFFNCLYKQIILSQEIDYPYDTCYLFKKKILILAIGRTFQDNYFLKIKDNLKITLEYIVKNDHHISWCLGGGAMRIYEEKNKRILLDFMNIYEFSYEN